jgi:hypothetical protein
MNETKTALNDLYQDLNSDFLKDLEAYAQENYSIGLFDLIEQYAASNDSQDIIESINELKENNSISCMEDYYQLIDYMFENMED